MKSLLALLLTCGMLMGQTATKAPIHPTQKQLANPLPLLEEPMDVPPLEENTHDVPWKPEASELPYFSEACGFVDGKMTYAPDPIACHVSSWTCADKSRILMTAEDGTKHCIKFPKNQRLVALQMDVVTESNGSSFECKQMIRWGLPDREGTGFTHSYTFHNDCKLKPGYTLDDVINELQRE